MAAVLRSLPFCAFEAMGTLRHTTHTHNTHTQQSTETTKKKPSLRSTRALFAPVSDVPVMWNVHGTTGSITRAVCARRFSVLAQLERI